MKIYNYYKNIKYNLIQLLVAKMKYQLLKEKEQN